MNTPVPIVEETTPAAEPNEALKFAFEVVHSYMDKIGARFSPGLSFSDRGLARAASVFGWIVGVAQGGNLGLANELAADFVENLDYLANYGGKVDHTYPSYNGTPRTVQIPSHVVKLCDDGTAHGFALLWHRPLLTPEQIEAHQGLGREAVTFVHSFGVPHGYAFNGGLLYHGPGAGETFSVSLTGNRLWSVHT